MPIYWYCRHIFYKAKVQTDLIDDISKTVINPISGRILATPISGRGGGCLGPRPLEISGSYRSIFKIQTAFVSPQHDLYF